MAKNISSATSNSDVQVDLGISDGVRAMTQAPHHESEIMMSLE